MRESEDHVEFKKCKEGNMDLTEAQNRNQPTAVSVYWATL